MDYRSSTIHGTYNIGSAHNELVVSVAGATASDGGMSCEDREERKSSFEELLSMQPATIDVAAHVFFYHRQRVVDWICEGCEQLELQCLTVHHAVHYLDRLCLHSDVNYEFIYYIAAACILIAAKFEESPNTTPLISEVVHVAKPIMLVPSTLASVEVHVLNRLDWKLRIATGYHFICEHKKWGMFPKEDRVVTVEGVLPATDEDKLKTCEFVKFFCELALRDCRFLRHSVSVSAAAAWAAGRAFTSISPLWPDSLAAKTGYSKHEIDECYTELCTAFKDQYPEAVTLDRAPSLWEEEAIIGSPSDVTDSYRVMLPGV